MLTITKPAPNRVDIELTAVLDGDMMAAALDELFEKSKDVEHGVMLYTISSFSLPTGGAFVAEMMRLPQLFEMIQHFERCAVVSDISWIRAAAEVEGAVIPGLAIKSFGTDQVNQAEAWLMATQNEEEDFEDNMPV